MVLLPPPPFFLFTLFLLALALALELLFLFLPLLLSPRARACLEAGGLSLSLAASFSSWECREAISRAVASLTL